MNQGKRKLRRRNTVFGRSKDDSFQVTNKARRKGQNSQNRWVKYNLFLFMSIHNYWKLHVY